MNPKNFLIVSFLLLATACSQLSEVEKNEGRAPRISKEADGIEGKPSSGSIADASSEAPTAPMQRPVDPVVPKDPGEAKDVAQWLWSQTEAAPFSTASIDVDTASYTRARARLRANREIQAEQVRVEDFLNYFPYDYAAPSDDKVVKIHQELVPSPWSEGAYILRLGMKAKDVGAVNPPKNLVFLVDVSGSMADESKLPLVKASLKALAETLAAEDKISLVTYAGYAEIALPATAGSEKAKIKAAIDKLGAGGGTDGGSGIKQAYEIAAASFIKNGVNRVVMTTDGDFNVGITSTEELVKLIKEKSDLGIFLTILGYGLDANDALMENVAKDGNGNYFFIDSSKEIEKVFGTDLKGNIVAVAKDVKIQVEFNPRLVKSYRLVGYVNRQLADEDFNNDAKDAGDLGSAQSVTYLYEIKLRDPMEAFASTYKQAAGVDALIYQDAGALTEAAKGEELGTFKVRYKTPEGVSSAKLDELISAKPSQEASIDTQWQIGVSAAAMGLAKIEGVKIDPAATKTLLESALGTDELGLRKEFLDLLAKASR